MRQQELAQAAVPSHHKQVPWPDEGGPAGRRGSAWPKQTFDEARKRTNVYKWWELDTAGSELAASVLWPEAQRFMTAARRQSLGIPLDAVDEKQLGRCPPKFRASASARGRAE